MRRLTGVGFEVRLVAGTEDGQEVSVVTTRTHARALGLEEGMRVWITPTTGATTVPAMKPLLSPAVLTQEEPPLLSCSSCRRPSSPAAGCCTSGRRRSAPRPGGSSWPWRGGR